MRVAFDMSSFMWKSLLVDKDKEFGYDAPHPQKADEKIWINTAKYGYENIINMMCAVFKQFQLNPIDALLVFEGMHSKTPRRRIEATYKEDDSRAPEAYQEFENLRTLMQSTWCSLGATAIQQDYVEGDDVLAYLARETESDLIVATGDRDLTVLNGVNAHGAKIQVRYNDSPLGSNPYGPWDLRLIPVHKALVGDTGDKIKGVVGFGKQTWIDFLVAYGEEGAFEVQRLLEETGRLGDLHTQTGDHKAIKLMCEQEAQCHRSYLLGKLHPEWVNTPVNRLKITAGMVKAAPELRDERLQQWYQRTTLITADNIEAWKKPLAGMIVESPFVTFDIETSTSEESDEWVDRQSNSDETDDRAVDVYGSRLTGFSLTMGRNQQHTFYFSVDHADTANISMEDAGTLIEMPSWYGKRLVIQNFSFEASVCYHHFGEKFIDNGFMGFLANMDDTKFMSSYVDENNSLGLKWRSEHVLGYKQQTYDETTLIKAPAYVQMFNGGEVVREYEAPDTVGQMVDGEMQYALVQWQDRRYKMNELPATHVFGYGCDDTICTSALYVYNRLVMELEHTWKVYREVEIDAAYQHAVNFECGIAISVEKINELNEADNKVYDDAWKIVRQYLIDNHYEGTVPPVFGPPLAPADIKLAYEIWSGGKKLDTGIRIRQKIITYITEVEEDPTFALMVASVFKAEGTENEAHAYAWFNSELAKKFKAEPDNPIGSPKKMNELLFEVMKLPVRVRNKATDKMRSAGIMDGNPKTDALAIAYAIQMDATEEQKSVLEAMKLMQMVRTRRSLYYTKYANFMHWTDGMVRPNHNQCAANTRRATESRPNKTQLPKHQKIEDQPARFREAIVPHKRGAVVVSMDFEAQELKIIAHYSRDDNLVACYVGDNKKDMHALTGLGIFNYKAKDPAKNKRTDVHAIAYEEFEAVRNGGDKSHPLFQYVKDDRNLGKKVNFTTEFGAMAPKVAQTLLVSEEDAQAFIDAREAMFPGVKSWKEGVISAARDGGEVRSMMGAMRHLLPMFTSGDNWVASKAERQAVNFKVQGSAAEQTKLAEGRMWRDGLFFEFDAACYGPIHDEVVASVMIEDLPAFIPRMHACMVGHFDNMSIPITSSISFGPDFYRQIEIGNEPTAEAIAAGIEKLKEYA